MSVLLAKLAYFLYVLSYIINKKLRLKSKELHMDEQQAEETVRAASPEPDIRFTCDRTALNGELDLSVIVPVYNYEKVLKQCLDSIVDQKTQYRYEIFMVDDGSTDGSALIVDSYLSHRNVHILRQENQGISAARNHALSQAAGKYIMFVDCDDYLEEDAVETLLSIAYRKNCDIVEGGYYTFGNDRSIRRNYIQKPIFLEHQNFDELMKYTGYPWAKVYKRELFDQVGFPVNSWFEDTLVKMILFRRCTRYAYCAKTVYGYRKYEGNYTEKQVKSTRGLEHIWMLRWIAQLSDSLHIESEESLYKALLYHLGSLYLYRIENTSQELQECAFLMGRTLLDNYAPEDRHMVKLPYMYKELERAYRKKDFQWWKHVCRYM